MISNVLIYVLLAALILEIALRLYELRRGRGLRAAFGRRVVIHTTDGQTIRGVLVELGRDGSYRLAAAEYIVGTDVRSAGGELYVFVRNVYRVQMAPEADA